MALLRVPLAFAVPGTVLTVVVGAQWLMLSVGSGLSSPNVVLGAFGWARRSASSRPSRSGAASARRGRLSSTGSESASSARWLLSGRRDARAAGRLGRARAALAGLRGVQAPRGGFLRLPPVDLGRQADPLAARGRPLAALYTASAALSWFSVIPAFAWIYVQIETVFYQRYRAFYSSLEGGGTLPLLRRARPDRSRRGAAHLAGSGARSSGSPWWR
jgi:hypothetical protein